MVKNLPGMQETLGSIPGLGRPPEEGNGNPLQYSCLENSMDSVTWQATIHRIAELDMTEHLTLSLSFSVPNTDQAPSNCSIRLC